MLTSNLFLISIGVLTLVAFAVLGLVLYYAAQGGRAKPAGERKIVRLRTDTLRAAFRQAIELIEGNLVSRAERYNIPWIMVLNEGDDARPLPIAQSGVSSALGTDAANAAATQGISWHFFDRGVVIDINAGYLGSPDDDGDEKPWDEFLGLCRNYRPQRPFDSVVITVPAAKLLADDTDAQLELVRRAKLVHRRLWLAQNRFAVRFAVYVVVTGAEALPGFAQFARDLPEPMRASMLGWSSPYDLSATYQSDWVEAALSSIVRSVSDSAAELLAAAPPDLDARQLLLLPARIEAMRAQLQRYIDELLRPSAYHEPFFFRGVYLTGDSGELAAQGLSAVPRGETEPEREDSESLPERIEPVLDAGESSVAGGTHLTELMLQPAFLRDLFDKKIFLEYGLTRPSRSQHLARPVVHRALRWGGVALLGLWGVGLAVNTWQLGQRKAELLAALGGLRNASQQRAQAEQAGQELPPEWYRRQTLGLIDMNQRLMAQSTWSVFMPGSWSPFDDLDERMREHFQREFGKVALPTIHREMLARVSQLTGVVRDPSTAELVIGDDCAVPAGARGDAGGPRTLAIEDLPEMRALQQYVGAVDQFDAALSALQRLENGGEGRSEALRTVVRYALGAELHGDVSGTLSYFRTDGGAGRGAHAMVGSAPAVGPAQVVQPLRCSYDKGARQLEARLFSDNALLVAERSVRDGLEALSGAGTDFSHVLGDYRGIVAGIGTQQELLAGGKAGWLRQPQFAPGPAYERLLAQATRSRLLGEDLVARQRERSRAGFAALREELAQRFSGPEAGIVWQDKEGRYAVAPERLALRDRLAALVSQPFMTAPRDLPLPALGARTVVNWDRQQLDQAMTLAETRKRFVGEGLADLPGASRDTVARSIDAQFTRLMMDQVAAAAVVAPAGAAGSAGSTGSDSAAFEAALGRLVKIKTALAEMHATARVEDLDALISRDALAHLRAVDEALQQSELYAIRQSGGDARSRSPMLAAFGLSDAAGLGPYLDQQSGRALALGREASLYLGVLNSGDAASPLAQRWLAITRDLERYRLKNPNSQLLMLEQFIQGMAADGGRGGCFGRFASRLPRGADDYFATLQARVYEGLLARCAQGYFAELQRQWDGFSAIFNERVAGHAPFGAAVQGGPNPADQTMADYGELGRVLKRYEQVSTVYREPRGDGPLKGLSAGMPVHQFMDNFEQVRTLLSPLYPADDSTPGGYDINVDFRVNRSAELAGNQIIDWSLSVGAQNLSQQEAPRSLRWEYGMPVMLTLRFAKDSPLQATADPRQRALSTDGRSMTWRFADPWALISFIGRQRVADPSVRAEGAASLLRFDFPLAPATPADLTAVPKQGQGRVFLRLALTPAGKKTPLPWPRSFPTRAPDWNPL
ncbi:type VI secretion system protein [Cupriavidus necator]|uniref:Type VI secretion system component TssM1 N-terminal domain-containing protein n=1 Tax=Cupriavidus pinatubonensis (strain JMP 134 / LMG 1197) TaxID=264198 RepID=Q470V3_CUPPJ|nr:type VI secretion system protein [Cupriavidus necator]